MSKIYITTAIPYANGKPHIGHAVDYVFADVYARYQSSLGNEVRLQAGTDEHGNKVFQKSLQAGVSVEEYTANISKNFRDFIAKLGVEYTDFIRTTDSAHIKRCQEIWQTLKPHIYKDSYDGWYCEGCENFVTEKEYEENNHVCPDHNQAYQKLTEENYYLRISDFKDQIREAIVSGNMKILPEFRKKEILNLLADSPDVSISRPRKKLTWGVPVPGDESQVMYVWLDALSNYITVLGFPDQDISDFWPAAVQFVGKDILRFHTIIWPSILLGVGLPLPKVVHSHGHVLANGQKMSKTIGNVVDPIEVIDRHGLSAFRYFFTRHIDTFADSDFTWEKFDEAYNNELANDLGNLVQRLATLAHKNQISGAPTFQPFNDPDYQKLMDNFEFSKAMEYTWTNVQKINKRIDGEKPWELAKLGKTTELNNLMKSLIDDMLQAAFLLTPFLPAVTTQIVEIFTAKTITPPAKPLFPKQ